ncbi:hypothetical protein CLUG_01847 [Clavispora lusitaniae ATCC 42720]|uniref:Uncharacterized protein n=1 Tax=Clavispora lusitaniae (strain ATCC 42720) TaxID=306902 RepID=C4Y0W5_CLAL4|nr:uncharacterized protein CLUG_01847 [Clavispora lusitaniae ATCC 42720]EEQ37723.1 hypothetical protein CLUG_01847 [Clavispora lusitaniae ATCC 42720]
MNGRQCVGRCVQTNSPCSFVSPESESKGRARAQMSARRAPNHGASAHKSEQSCALAAPPVLRGARVLSQRRCAHRPYGPGPRESGQTLRSTTLVAAQCVFSPSKQRYLVAGPNSPHIRATPSSTVDRSCSSSYRESAACSVQATQEARYSYCYPVGNGSGSILGNPSRLGVGRPSRRQ